MAASHAGVALVAVGIGIGVKDGVHQRVGALGGLDGAVQADFAAGVNSIGQNDERFAAVYLLRHFIGGEEDGVIQIGASAAAMPAAAATTARVAAAASRAPRELGVVQLFQGGLQLGARGGHVLQELDLPIEVNDESLVLVVRAHQVVEEAVAGNALLLD